MKKILLLTTLFFTIIGVAQQQEGTFTVSPPTFEQNEEITITVSGVDPAVWGVSDVYFWAWYINTSGNFGGDSPTNGTWESSSEAQKMTDNGDGTFSITFTPTTFYNANDIGQLGMLAKAKDGNSTGNGERKTQDNLIPVGTFQVSLDSPLETTNILNSGDVLSIQATASLNANFELTQNGSLIDTQNGITSYSNNLTITQDSNFVLTATEPNSGEIFEFNINAVLTPDVTIAPVPAGAKNGINYNTSNPDEITLVLFAPNKEFVHVIGNFNNNNWTIDNTYLMNFDDTTNQHWITLNNFSAPNDDFLFQYSIEADIVVPDPYSELVLDRFNDQFIEELTFPNIPSYPQQSTSELISWVKVNQTDYQWQAENFTRPAQEDLVIYELLIRDFDAAHSFQSVISRLDYLEELGINAIELMPVNEFDGNINWGYSPALHMALDKYYGSPHAFKAFVDACHQRGIAVILDVVFNHATGQHPYYRMYNDCGGCYEGQATPENPIFNVSDPNSTFSFFNDIDHESQATEEYMDQINRFWIEEYKIDGYRFDFTKGFTNTPGDGGSFDQARIDNLTRMYDEIRSYDNDAYIILEHFAPDSEEEILINHRATSNSEEPGMLVWGNVNFNYNQATMGYDNSNFRRVSAQSRGWSTPSVVGYMESHDEERLMYKNLEFGNREGSYDTRVLETALDRMELAGAFYFTIPGPKMIWQFGELGYEFSINRCEDGTINDDCRTGPKPIPWNLGYQNNQDRTDVYNFWSKLITLRNNEPIFKTDNFTLEVADDVNKKIYLVDDSATGSEPKYVIIVGNFGVTSITTQPFFQEAGTWFDAVTETTIEVTNTSMNVSLAPGEFKIYFNNQPSTLSTNEVSSLDYSVYPNPAKDYFSISNQVDSVQIFDVNGRLLKEYKGGFEAKHRFGTDQLNPGLYFIKYTNQKQSQAEKLIIH
ncbi:alpha-amylase family glycosyl hydrolase [Psychroflexus sediminis]|uniref:Por secretion system C-terminal sorting domain-containing protein n=1 Tax=Psychroflexus sediminis TaxID=470826 RepID=A0A1G7WPG6_9FLAO|nr:alpha-amylase family glycosyl hydrolase [Psychroflexus sediminis]SDG73774.1 Por secretion system C-terminal sorting domain-containing protein [Psychroflexus sediminis]